MSQDHTRYPEGTQPPPWYESKDSNYAPGITANDEHGKNLVPRGGSGTRNKVEDWFKRPLEGFKDEDSLVCMIVCLPLIEKYVRFKVRESGKGDHGGFGTPDGAPNPLLAELRKFLGVPTDSDARFFYETFRNGLLHRAMPNFPCDGMSISLRPEFSQPPIVVENAPDATKLMTVYVWSLRDHVVDQIFSQKNKMWTMDKTPLLQIFVEPA